MKTKSDLRPRFFSITTVSICDEKYFFYVQRHGLQTLFQVCIELRITRQSLYSHLRLKNTFVLYLFLKKRQFFRTPYNWTKAYSVSFRFH